MLDNIKQRVGSGDIVNKLLASTEEVTTGKNASGGIDPKTTEVIIIYKMLDKMSAENTESYDKAALEAWAKNKFKIQFFPITRLVNNPMKHVLQPKFEIVSEEQKKIVMKECYARDLSQFPFIKFHNDAVARFMGLVPGQMVKITSASPTAGEYVKYRVCAP
jgi:DNA-directed RNA polymerase I, II, and III subunit RPABC1